MNQPLYRWYWQGLGTHGVGNTGDSNQLWLLLSCAVQLCRPYLGFWGFTTGVVKEYVELPVRYSLGKLKTVLKINNFHLGQD